MQKHILVISFPAFGHITPLLELSKRLSKYHRISFAVSSSKADAIANRGLIPAHYQHQIAVLPIEDGLTPDYDKIIDPKHLAAGLQQMEPAQRELLRNMPILDHPNGYRNLQPVDVVIADNCLPVPIPACKARGIPGYAFCCAAAWTTVGMLALTEATPECDDEVYYNEKDHTIAGRIPRSLKQWMLGCQDGMVQANAIIINSFEDLEPDARAQIQDAGGPPVHFVGPLFPTELDEEVAHQVAHWLDGQPVHSVIYISFGSMATPVPNQIVQIAETLLALGRPFIWSLRSDQHRLLPAAITDQIPSQLDIKKVQERQFLILPWAPQKTVLSHRATRVFISHCGWNSTMEGIASGVPVVAWPMFGDQPLNAALVLKLGLGLVIPDVCVRGLRIVSAGELSEIIEAVAGWKKRDSTFHEAVGKFARKTREAVEPGGTSANDFKALLRRFI
ncbi:putative UDP-glycosyltransferase 74D1 [Hypsibius exemplaris]|uniref:UDP-glucuronosyltransferase n=1 Tax=Hypsibius exemplaris TaxID=2072580 RepID=A0A9X6NIL2_HYPEX|nr:putative UDP-glycosyltransferase 74D1 [Hypsibius exemplaris]